MRKTLLVVFSLLFSGMIVAQEPIPINNTDSLWLTEHLEPLPDSVFPYRQMEQEAPPGYSCSTCIETGNDLPTGDRLSCEDFEAYTTGLLLPDAHPWRKWYTASPRAVIANLQGTKTARFTGGADMLYQLGDKTTGRYRVSWRMYVPTGKKGYFSFQHTLPNINSNTSFGANWAYHVYFDGASKGRLVIVNGTNTATTIEFGYPEDKWFNVVNILSPDHDPDLRSANLFINNSFVYFWYFNQGTNPSNQLSAINFYADADNDFYVDNICYWGKKAICPTSTILATVCIKNGEQAVNASAARCRLYTSREWWECSIACDFGGPYVYRGDNYTGTLDLSDFIFTKDPTTCAIFSTAPEIMDVFLFYKDDNMPFKFKFNGSSTQVYPYIFACKVPNNVGDCLRKQGICIDIDGDGNILAGDLPCNNLYYICIIGPAGSTYSFNILEAGPCAANPDKINFNPTTGAATVSGAVAASGSNFSKAGNAYKSCYSGNRSYAAGEKIYQFTLNRPSEVSVTLSSSSRMGVFLYSFLCGRDCIGFAENTPTQNGVLTARLNDGTYYLIIDKESGASNNFALNFLADDFSPFSSIALTQAPPVLCAVTPNESHTVQLRAGAYNPPLTVRDQIHFLFKDPVTNTFKGHDSLIFNWNGSAAMNFKLKKDYLSDLEKCSYMPGDTFVVFVVQSENGKRVYRKMYPKYTTANGKNFVIGGQSVINDLTLVETVAFGTQKLELNPGPAESTDTLVFSTNQYWQVEEQPIADWLSVTPEESDGTEEVKVMVKKNDSEKPRSAILRFYATNNNNPGLYQQFVKITQKGTCNAAPTLSINPPMPQICVTGSVRLDAVVDTGLEDVFNYSWSGPGVTNATARFLIVSPTNTTTYTLTISNKTCDATATKTVNVIVNGLPAAPSNPVNGTICQGAANPFLSVTVPAGHEAEWFNSNTVVQPMHTGLSYQPNISIAQPATYTFWAGAKSAAGCVSSSDKRTAVTLTIKPRPNPSPGAPVCAPDLKTYSVEVNTNGAVITNNFGVKTGGGNLVTITGVPKNQNLTLTGTLNGCSVDRMVTAPVCNCPNVPPPTWLRNEAVCFGQALPALEVQVGPGETVDWYDDKGVKLPTGMGTARYAPAVAGTYYAETRNLITECRSATKTAVTLTVHPLPTLVVNAKTCAIDLSTYSLAVQSDAPTLSAGPWTVANSSGGFTVSGVPVGQNVSLVATNARCFLAVVESSPVCACPTVNPPRSDGDKTVCSGQPLPPLSVIVGNGETANWYDQSGTLLRENFNSFTPLTAGTYFAETRNTSSGCRSSVKTPVRLTVLPLPVLTVGTKECSPDLNTYSVQVLSNGSLSANIGAVSGGNGFFTISNIPKNTSVTITAALNGCTKIMTETAPSCACPALAAPVSGGDVTVCAGEPMLPLVVTTNFGESVKWYNQAGALVASGTLSYQPSAPGVYYAEAYRPANQCVSASRTPVSFSVAALPSVGPVETMCNADLLTYTILLNAPDNVTVESSLGTVSYNNGRHTVAGIPSNNEVVLTVRNAANCAVQVSVKAPVCTCPFVSPPVSLGDKSVCVNQPLPVLSVSVGPDQAADWYNQEGKLLYTGSSFAPTVGDIYFAEARNLNNECRSGTKIPVSLTIHPLPSLQVTAQSCAVDLKSYQLAVSSNGILTANIGAVSGGNGTYTVANIPKTTGVLLSAQQSQTGCAVQLAVAAPDCACPAIATPATLGDQTVCLGEPAPVLSVAVKADETVNWYDASGVQVARQQLTFRPTVPGVYFAEAQQLGNNCISSARTAVEYILQPAPAPIIESKICTDNLSFYKVRLAVTSSAVLATSKGMIDRLSSSLYEIKGIPKDSNVVITVTDTLTYCSIRLTEAAPACNCPSVAPPVSVGNLTVCAGETIPALRVQTGNNETANWYDQNGVLVAEKTLMFAPTAAGTWFAEAENLLSKCKSTVKTPVSVAFNPKPILVLLDTFCANNRESYAITVSTNEGIPVIAPVFPYISNGAGSYTFSAIPFGRSVDLKVKAQTTGCETNMTVTKLDCPCPAISAPISKGDKEICAGSELPLLSVSVGPNEIVSWYSTPMGDTYLSTGTEYQPLAPGTYYAQTQNIISPCTSNERTPVRLVEFDPVVVGTKKDTSVCAGQPVPLSGSINNGLGGRWTADVLGGDFSPNNNFFTAQSYTPPDGVSTVVLTLTSDDPPGPCPVASSDLTVNIIALPGISGVNARCAADLNTWSVDFFAPGIVQANPGTLEAQGGDRYTVNKIPKGNAVTIQIKDTSTHCENRLFVQSPNCACPFVLPPVSTGNKQVCEGIFPLPVLSVTPVVGQIVNWYKTPSGGNPVSLASPTFSPSAAGTYYAEAVQEINGCPSGTRTAVTLTILQNPVADAGPNQLVCLGDTATLTAVANGVTYRWDNGASTQSIRVFATQPRTYSLTVTSPAGCTATGNVNVGFHPAFTTAIETKKDIRCFGEPAGALQIKINGGTPPFNILWNTGSQLEAINNLPAGTYIATVTDWAGCRAVVQNELNQPPPIRYDPPVIQHSIGGSAGTGSIALNAYGGTPPLGYAWSQDNFKLPGENQSVIDSLVPGDYRVTISDQNGCTVQSQIIKIMTTQTSTPEWAAGAHLFPNPTTGHLYVELLHLSHKEKWQVSGYTAAGQVLIGLPIKQMMRGFEVDFSGQPDGAYLIEITDGNERASWKVTVLRER